MSGERERDKGQAGAVVLRVLPGYLANHFFSNFILLLYFLYPVVLYHSLHLARLSTQVGRIMKYDPSNAGQMSSNKMK